jgi:hydrogenase maturation protease
MIISKDVGPLHRWSAAGNLKRRKTLNNNNKRIDILILGIGNVLMGDEGIGVHVARRLRELKLPSGVESVDGGTGGFYLLEMTQGARRVILIDATVDDRPPGSIQCLSPRFSSDYPRTLTAHDIGLKDLLDALLILGDPPDVTLFAVSISPPTEVSMELSPGIESVIPKICDMVLESLESFPHSF